MSSLQPNYWVHRANPTLRCLVVKARLANHSPDWIEEWCRSVYYGWSSEEGFEYAIGYTERKPFGGMV